MLELVVDETVEVERLEEVMTADVDDEDVRLTEEDVAELIPDVVLTVPVLHREAGGAEKESQEPPSSVPVWKASLSAVDPLPLTTSILAEYDRLASGIV